MKFTFLSQYYIKNWLGYFLCTKDEVSPNSFIFRNIPDQVALPGLPNSQSVEKSNRIACENTLIFCPKPYVYVRYS